MNIAVSEPTGSLDLYDLLDEFMRMLRDGKKIPVREFAKQHPDFAEEIVAHFPALLMAEGLKPRLSTTPDISGSSVVEEPPELLAGYRVLRQVGKGGMGVVYQAVHASLSRKLAIKILLGHKGKRKLSERFKREAEAASRLNHPNIVPVFDFGEQSGVQYLVMPLVEGSSLDQLFENYFVADSSSKDTQSMAGVQTSSGPTTRPNQEPDSTHVANTIIGPAADFQKLAFLGAEVASALKHAHENNTIHRDIKPGNLILDNDGKIWVTDFGLAKTFDDECDLSRTGDVIGTPRFMAPEQVRGLCDERSDVYSLGVTLYEMAAGSRAWDTLTSGQLLTARATAELPELAERAPHVPKPLAEIIMKACSFRPEDRYQSANELQVVLNRFAHGQKTGDRRRRSRIGGSAFHRQRTVIGLLVLIPILTLLTMYFFKAGPWTDELETQKALMSLVEDDAKRERIVEQLPDIIEAALTSQDQNVREQASDLTMKVFEESLKKSGVTATDQEAILDRAKLASENYRKNGLQYSDYEHPLSNAIRNADLDTAIKTLKLNAITLITCKFQVASLGKMLEHKLLSEQEISTLLGLLPAAAQFGPTDQKVDKASLIKFLHVTKDIYARLSRDPVARQTFENENLFLRTGHGQENANGTRGQNSSPIAIPDNVKDLLKKKLLEAAAAKQRARAGR